MKQAMWSFHLAAALTVAMASTAPAAEGPPKQGEKAADFTLNSLDGAGFTLSNELKSGKVVLVVLRGYPGYQCPVCSAQVADLRKRAEALSDANAKVVMVYPGPADGLKARAREFLKGATLPRGFQILLDPDYTFTNAYGLRWNAPNETAYPSTFVIEQDRVIRFAQVSKTHGGRARTSDILSALAR